jgi:hypothetical protein
MTSSNVNNRDFELNYFPSISKMEKYVSKLPKIDGFVGKLERRLPTSIQTKIGVMTESNAHRFKNPPRLIDGSFEQTFFLPDLKNFQSILNFPDEDSKWFQDNFKFNLTKFVVAIHVRRTDYINLANIYDVIDQTYYMRAVDLIRKRNKRVDLHLFSDDPDGAIEWLGGLMKFDKVITPPKNTPSGEVLKLISTYDAIVAANSTFSWWAAFLGRIRNNNLQIVLPKKFSNLRNDEPEKYLNIDGAVFL